ncbi:hypothetical protein PHLH3_08620 [Pseudomonas sp. St386]|uniref:terminase small subunit n=1 Tax=Pseudomonas TaxID=286 RepID=UPI0007202626|nr:MULTISPECIES: terminase small subunit [Pseudomonas]ALQ01478.1 Phage terminase, small subunit [Pseudomonas brassicacearum]BBP51236.1 hypothetical protein PHLH3_08620 [Pseudomonas sp. St386]
MKLSSEQRRLFEQLTELQQRTATNVLSGMSQREAYKAAGGRAKSDSAADQVACVMLSNIKVKAFMDSMKESALSDAVMSRQEAMERLSSLARISLTDLIEFGSYELGDDGEGNPVVQTSFKIRDSALQDPKALPAIAELTAGRDGIKIKQHSPLAAIKQLADMQGWNAPVKQEVTGKDGGPIETKDLTDNEVARRIAFLLSKGLKP